MVEPNNHVAKQFVFIDRRYPNLKSWSSRLYNNHIAKIRVLSKKIWFALPREERMAVRAMMLNQER
jgi:hypothetical protein